MKKIGNCTYKTFLQRMVKEHKEYQWCSWEGRWVDDDTLCVESKHISLYYYPKENKWYVNEIKNFNMSYKTINAIKDLTGSFITQLDYARYRNENNTI